MRFYFDPSKMSAEEIVARMRKIEDEAHRTDAWSEEARQAALEARQKNAAGGHKESQAATHAHHMAEKAQALTTKAKQTGAAEDHHAAALAHDRAAGAFERAGNKYVDAGNAHHQAAGEHATAAKTEPAAPEKKGPVAPAPDHEHGPVPPPVSAPAAKAPAEKPEPGQKPKRDPFAHRKNQDVPSQGPDSTPDTRASAASSRAESKSMATHFTETPEGNVKAHQAAAKAHEKAAAKHHEASKEYGGSPDHDHHAEGHEKKAAEHHAAVAEAKAKAKAVKKGGKGEGGKGEGHKEPKEKGEGGEKKSGLLGELANTASEFATGQTPGEIVHGKKKDDANFEESKHPRSPNGQFGSGGEGGQHPEAEGGASAAWKGKGEGHSSTEDAYKHDGQWAPERQKLHEDYVNSRLEGVPRAPAGTTVYMTGGGPASGKTTALLENPKTGIPGRDKAAHIDADSAKGDGAKPGDAWQGLPEFRAGVAARDPAAAAFVQEESSAMSKLGVDRAIKTGRDLVYDSTGDSGIDNLTKKVEGMRAAGVQRVIANYATIDVDEAVRRSNARAATTGRFVPEAVVRGIHHDVSKTCAAAMKSGVYDECHLWDNTAREPRRVASYTRQGGFQVHDQALWDAFRARGA